MKQIIILLGPTGVGKTGASILLAHALDTEIISADSMQIYRGMDIGTAKPSEAERSGVKHHMIDIADPTEPYSAGEYIKTIAPIIEDLHARGKVPLIVGGTGLYIKAVTRGIFSGPSADWDLRQELLMAEGTEQGILYEYLLKVDPDAAARIERKDTRRVVRALEVCLKGKDRMSILQERLTRPLPYDFIKIGLTRNREELYGMIERRVDRMLEKGLIDEVKALVAKSPDRTSLQAIGYKEIISCIRGEISMDEAVRLVKRNTRRYAKRQFAWFKKEEGIRWIEVTGILKSMCIFREIMKALE